MSSLTIAHGRRSDEIKDIQEAIASIERDAANGANGANGMANAYLAERLSFLKEEKARLEDVIAELCRLSDDALVERYVPEVKAVSAPTMREMFPNRGEFEPEHEIVSREPLPNRQVGPRIVPLPSPQSGQPISPERAQFGHTYSYDANGNLVVQ
jgi:hypothetical protein